MFSEHGDAAVSGVVYNAHNNDHDYEHVQEDLFKLAKVYAYGEATDTAVRESVWMDNDW
jgi:zona occludens toxin (predicted ATPase)